MAGQCITKDERVGKSMGNVIDFAERRWSERTDLYYRMTYGVTDADHLEDLVGIIFEGHERRGKGNWTRGQFKAVLAERLYKQGFKENARAEAKKRKQQRKSCCEMFGRDPATVPQGWGDFGRLICTEKNVDSVGLETVMRSVDDSGCMEIVERFVRTAAESVGYEFSPERLRVEAEWFVYEVGALLNS